MQFKKDYIFLIKNVMLFAISSFSIKIISYIILPLYTGNVSGADYGIIDLITVVINLLVPILSLSISDWMLRYVTEDQNQAKEKFSVSIYVILISSIFLLALSPLLNMINSLKGAVHYLIIGYFLSSVNLLFSYMVRAINKVKLISLCSVLSALITVALNLLWNSLGTLSIDSYFISQYVGTAFGLIIFFILGGLYKYIEKVKYTYELKNEIISYCFPLIPNALFWWVNSCIDKICIISLIGIAMSGFYSAASKIPSLLTIFATIFQQAWNLSVFKKKTYSQNKFESTVFFYFQILLIVGATIIIIFSKWIASVLLHGEFFDSWTIVPMLVVAFVFTTVSTFIGSFFTVAKDTKPLFWSTLYSAVLNIILNIVLIKTIGLYGAAIATMSSALFNYIYRIELGKKKKYISESWNLYFFPLYFALILLSLLYKYLNHAVLELLVVGILYAFIIIGGYIVRRIENEKSKG